MDIQKYNQKVLAILGTVSIVAVAIITIFLIFFSIAELFRDQRSTTVIDNTLIADVDDESLPRKRVQEITFYSPMLIDTLSKTYLIPVSQVNLKNPEEIQDFHGVAKEAMSLVFLMDRVVGG